MTKEEAIKELKEMKTDAWTDHRQMEAIDMAIDQKLKSIPQILEDIVNEMCDKYCKYPQEWDEEAEGIELSDSDICANCPLNRLV